VANDPPRRVLGANLPPRASDSEIEEIRIQRLHGIGRNVPRPPPPPRHSPKPEAPVTIQGRGFTASIPAVVIASVISAFGARQIPSASPEGRALERVESRLERAEDRATTERYDRDRREKQATDRLDRFETTLSLCQQQIAQLRRELMESSRNK
jgi:hypothetical protein